MATMLNVYDRQTRKKTAVLQNAYDIIETHELNQIYTLSFTLPSSDDKNKYCLPRHYVRWGDTGELYRIKTPKVDESNIGTITYECEHVITTLCDSIMFGSFQYGGKNIKTAQVIRWLLNSQRQKASNWELGECDFELNYEYLWEQENILNALYSIPKEFATPYKWVFDTTGYPWKISLKAIDPTAKPEYYLRAKSNILASGSSADYANICTRLYPLGYGEGVNQLTIKDVNNGVAYLQSPASIVNQYGIVEKVLVERQFESAESLKAYAQSMLDVYQTPSMTRSFDVTDLYPLTGQSWDDAEVGKICKMTQDGSIAYITKTKWQRDLAGDLQIDLSTKATDIAANVADLADRVRIESVYAQGATQLYQHSKDANATPSKGMTISLYFPSEMRQINKVLMRLKLNKFRSYSQTTEAGGSRTTESGGASQKTTEGGSVNGSTSISTTGGGTIDVDLIGTAANTDDANWYQKGNLYVLNAGDLDVHMDSNGSHSHDLEGNVSETTLYPSEYATSHTHYFSSGYGAVAYTDTRGNHTHAAYVPEHNHMIRKYTLRHNHPVTISVTSNKAGQTGFAHSHTFSVGSHTHKVDIPAHTHGIPTHKHNIAAGIFESGNPTAFDIYIGNTKKDTVDSKSYDGDITAWLLNDKNQIPRNTWIDLKIVPNDNAYVVASVFIQGFVQSRGGGNY